MPISTAAKLQSFISTIPQQIPLFSFAGRVVEISGLTVKANITGAAIGNLVSISRANNEPPIMGQVVGSKAGSATITLSELPKGIFINSVVRTRASTMGAIIGPHLLGCVVDGHGRTIKTLAQGDTESLPASMFSTWHALDRLPPKPFERAPLTEQLSTGIKALDSLVPIAYGQRIAIFAEPGVGKSSLLAQLASSSEVDISVIALIGERGREVQEFIDEVLSPEQMARAVVVVSTSDEPPILRTQAALLATTIAEYFRDGGLRVLLQLDSLTRLARALRDLALAANELPVRRGYPASTFAALPSLLERAGKTKLGSITGVYTMLLSNGVDEDPMVEEVKGLLDGHLVLSTELAQRGLFPAIDPLASLSRLVTKLTSTSHRQNIETIREFVAKLRETKEAQLFGGTLTEESSDILALEPDLYTFLKQSRHDRLSPADTESAFDALLKKLRTNGC